jgi:ribulose-phosphate 3-epimerase
MQKRIRIAPSVLSADLARLQEEVESIEADADWMQIDVMDGHFVPNLSFGAPVMKCLKTGLLLDVHLMVTNPADRVEEFLEAGAGHITFHAEAVTKTKDRKALIKKIKEGGATAGIAVNPATPLSDIEDVLADVDLVLVMSIVPGFSGQAFMPEVLSKVKELRKRFPKLMIQMDGGINDKTAPRCIQAGADNLVSATYVFSAPDRGEAIRKLRHA